MKDIVMISSNCKHSEAFMRTMGSLPIKNQFLYYSTDPDPVTKQQNVELLKILEIERTPTVYHNGQKYAGKQAFQWLQQIIAQLQQSHGGHPARQEPISGSMRMTPQVPGLRQFPPPSQQPVSNYPGQGIPPQQQEHMLPAAGGAGGFENFATFDSPMATLPGPPPPGGGFNEKTNDPTESPDQLLLRLQQERAAMVAQPTVRH